MTSDRRVKYTLSALEDALLELMADKPIERISVKELCDKADVNRSTFYAHFGSPQELLDSITDTLFERFSSMKIRNMTLEQVITESMTVLSANTRLFKALYNTREGIIGYSARLLYIWENAFIESMKAQGMDEETAKPLYAFIASGSAVVIGTRTVGGVNKSTEETVEIIKKITDAIIDAYTRRQ